MTEEIANPNQVYDYRASGRTVTIDFSNNILELKYFVRNKEELKNFLQNLEDYQEEVKAIRKDLKFGKIICRFDFGKQEVSENVLKRLIDFQYNVFDEITVQKIRRDNALFKRLLEYTFNSLKQ